MPGPIRSWTIWKMNDDHKVVGPNTRPDLGAKVVESAPVIERVKRIENQLGFCGHWPPVEYCGRCMARALLADLDPEEEARAGPVIKNLPPGSSVYIPPEEADG